MESHQNGKKGNPNSPMRKVKPPSSPSSPFTYANKTPPPLTLSNVPRNLENARVVQRNLVYIINLPLAVSDEATLSSPFYFGKYGKILKTHVNRGLHNSADPTSGAYLTYSTEEEAALCIRACHDFVLDGKKLSVTFGTTKYCSYFLKNSRCQKAECVFLHSMGESADIVYREEMLSTKHIQPQDSMFDKIKVTIYPPLPPSRLPEARLVRDRTASEQVELKFSPPRHRVYSKDGGEMSKYTFTLDNSEGPVQVPRLIEKLRLFATPCKDMAIIPSEDIDEIMSPSSPDKWAADVMDIMPCLEMENKVIVSIKQSL